MSAETVIVTGHGLTIEHQADDRPNPKRKRPPEYAPPAPTDVDLLATITALGRSNPHWTPEANADAEANPLGLTPKQLARKWRRHRITPHEAA